MSAPWVLRPGKPEDEALIYATWINSYRASAWGRAMRPHTFSVGHHDLIDVLLSRARTIVACSPDDVDQVFGWACYELRPAAQRVVLHYVLVKQSPNYQRFGIGRALVEEVLREAYRADIAGPSAAAPALGVSHMTDVGQKILDAHPQLKIDHRFAYSPYLAFMPESRLQW